MLPGEQSDLCPYCLQCKEHQQTREADEKRLTKRFNKKSLIVRAPQLQI